MLVLFDTIRIVKFYSQSLLCTEWRVVNTGYIQDHQSLCSVRLSPTVAQTCIHDDTTRNGGARFESLHIWKQWGLT